MKYIEKCSEGIVVLNDAETVLNFSLKRYLNEECLKYGSTYEGRVHAAKYLNKTKGLVPLYVNPKVVWIFTKNIREWDVELINYCRILSLREMEYKQVLVIFDDFTECILNVSFNRFNIQYKLAKKMNQLLL